MVQSDRTISEQCDLWRQQRGFWDNPSQGFVSNSHPTDAGQKSCLQYNQTFVFGQHVVTDELAWRMMFDRDSEWKNISG